MHQCGIMKFMRFFLDHPVWKRCVWLAGKGRGFIFMHINRRSVCYSWHTPVDRGYVYSYERVSSRPAGLHGADCTVTVERTRNSRDVETTLLASCDWLQVPESRLVTHAAYRPRCRCELHHVVSLVAYRYFLQLETRRVFVVLRLFSRSTAQCVNVKW